MNLDIKWRQAKIDADKLLKKDSGKPKKKKLESSLIRPLPRRKCVICKKRKVRKKPGFDKCGNCMKDALKLEKDTNGNK